MSRLLVALYDRQRSPTWRRRLADRAWRAFEPLGFVVALVGWLGILLASRALAPSIVAQGTLYGVIGVEQNLDNNLFSSLVAQADGTGSGWGTATTNATVTTEVTTVLSGVAAVKMSSVASGDMSMTTASAGNQGTVVATGHVYSFFFSLRAAATTRNAIGRIDWYDSTGTLICQTPGTATSVPSGAWTAVSVTGVAPVGAVYALANPVVQSTAGAAEIFYFDQPMFSWTGANLLSSNQQSLTTDTTGWAAKTNCAIARSTAQQLDTGSLQLTSTAGGTMDATTPTGTSGFAVTAGITYVATALARTIVSARSATVGIYWYKIDGSASATASNVSSAVTDSTSGWTLAFVSAAAPSDAAYAAIVVSVAATGAGSEVHDFDLVSLNRGAIPATWEAGGGLITTAGNYVAKVNLRNLSNNDVVEIRAYDVLFPGDTEGLCYLVAEADSTDQPVQVSVPVVVTTQGRFTVKQTAGVARAIPFVVDQIS